MTAPGAPSRTGEPRRRHRAAGGRPVPAPRRRGQRRVRPDRRERADAARIDGDARARRSRPATATGCRTSSPAGSSSASPWPGPWRPNPALVLLDEPFTALDAALRGPVRADVRAALRRDRRHRRPGHPRPGGGPLDGRPRRRVRNGKVAQCDTPQEVYQHPVDPWVARFVGQVRRAAGLGSPAGSAAHGARRPVPVEVAETNGGRGRGAGRRRRCSAPEQLRLLGRRRAGDGTPGEVVGGASTIGHDALVRGCAIRAPVEGRGPLRRSQVRDPGRDPRARGGAHRGPGRCSGSTPRPEGRRAGARSRPRASWPARSPRPRPPRERARRHERGRAARSPRRPGRRAPSTPA